MGNFSRNTFTVLKAPDANGFYRDYRGVRLQMGVPLVDADWNELEDARKAELRDLSAAVIGTGVPLGSNGFAIAVQTPAPGAVPSFTMEAGSMVAEGLLVTNKVKINYTQQEYYAGTQAGQQRATARGVAPIPVLTALPAYSGNTVARTDTVYLEVWEREVNSQEDPRMMDNALLEETSVRLRLEWAVRVAQNGAAMPASGGGFTRVKLATVVYTVSGANQASAAVQDERRRGLSLSSLVDQDRSVSVVPLGFEHSSYWTNWRFYNFSAYGEAPAANGTANHGWYIPVTLPDGARITGLRIVGQKQGGQFWVYFGAVSMTTNTWVDLIPHQYWDTVDNFPTLDVTVATPSTQIVSTSQNKYLLIIYSTATRRSASDADLVVVGGLEIKYRL